MILENLTGVLFLCFALFSFFVAGRAVDTGSAGVWIGSYIFGFFSSIAGGYILLWSTAVVPLFHWFYELLPQEGIYTVAYASILTFLPCFIVAICWVCLPVVLFSLEPRKHEKKA